MFDVLNRHLLRKAVCGASLLATAGMIGCQVDVGGQTLPSAYYLSDDIQYFPAGPRMKLSREAAALKAYREEEILRQGRGEALPPPPLR